jgi:hypothetical protein
MIPDETSRICPIPPRSILVLKKLWPHARKRNHEIGEIRRVGYYSPQDGLDVVWLVDNDGNYNWTTDHEWLYAKFEVITYSNEKNMFGDKCEPLGYLQSGEIREIQKEAQRRGIKK